MRCFYLAILSLTVAICAQDVRFEPIEILPNGEAALRVSAASGATLKVDVSTNLQVWQSLQSLRSAGANALTDNAAPYFPIRYYRAEQLAAPSAVVGDHLPTAEEDVVIRPIFHATFVMQWNGKTIYNDPAPSATYVGLPQADLILVSHGHGDHFNASHITSLRAPEGKIIAPQAVYNSMTAALRTHTIVLANGAVTNILGLNVEAVPAYNSNHPQGQGNGYVVTIGGKRLYMAGDTGDTPQMKALEDIDVAFLPMNLPFTMSVNAAALATRTFRPKVVYPYHFRNQDGTYANLNTFKSQVGQDLGIEVRIRKWY